MSDPSKNRVTEYRYNGDGRLTQLIAHNAATGDQVTEWEYGTALGESGVASFDLVRRKVYPEGAGGSDEVTFGYDRLGELTGMTDQNGTVHEYAYDGLGRLVRDLVTGFGEGVDEAIMMILRSYNRQGLLETVTQATNSDPESPAIRDQVRFGYNGFGQLLTEEQEHDGEVESGVSPQVSYSYEDGSENTVRRLKTTYPNGREVSFEYGEADSIDDLMDRVAEIRDDDVARVGYVRRGITSTVEVGYVEPGIKLTYLLQAGMPVGDAGDDYTGLDRFNRIEDIRWLKTATGEDVERFQYGFDRGGQRTWRRHVTAPDTTVTQGGWDESYRYDGLGQLINLTRGDLNQNRTAIAAVPKWEEQFDYDATGNWGGYRTLVDGAQNLDQSRTHNPANEITAISEAPETVAYDGAGNMTKMPKVGEWTTAQALTWDAWNRLVKVEEGNAVIGTYAYDGLVRRMWKVSAEDSVETQRHYYYSDQWQVLEERIDGATEADRQFLWGLRYIDDLVLRDRFGGSEDRLYALHDQWHVTAITDAEGEVAEHYAYEAFGQSLVQAPDYTVRDSSVYDWEVRFGAYRFDQETEMHPVRRRVFSSPLGRWASRDPLPFVYASLVYSYIENTPASGVDVYGLEEKRECVATIHVGHFGHLSGTGPDDSTERACDATPWDRLPCGEMIGFVSCGENKLNAVARRHKKGIPGCHKNKYDPAKDTESSDVLKEKIRKSAEESRYDISDIQSAGDTAAAVGMNVAAALDSGCKNKCCKSITVKVICQPDWVREVRENSSDEVPKECEPSWGGASLNCK